MEAKKDRPLRDGLSAMKVVMAEIWLEAEAGGRWRKKNDERELDALGEHLAQVCELFIILE